MLIESFGPSAADTLFELGRGWFKDGFTHEHQFYDFPDIFFFLPPLRLNVRTCTDKLAAH